MPAEIGEKTNIVFKNVRVPSNIKGKKNTHFQKGLHASKIKREKTTLFLKRLRICRHENMRLWVAIRIGFRLAG
jgi:uncharacterized Fe-S cluster-containing radical SAM superfamily protein